MFVLPHRHPIYVLKKHPGLANMEKPGAASRVMLKKLSMLFTLWLISQAPRKPYDVIKVMRAEGFHGATANRIYPLFAFMEKAGLVRGRKTGDRRASREYSITPKGRHLLKACREWFRTGMKKDFIKYMVG